MSTDDDHEDYVLWRRFVDEFLARGEPMPEAIRSANRLVLAHRKRREEARAAAGQPSGKIQPPDVATRDEDEPEDEAG